jgi:AraC-like DNA-binding protein
MSKANELLASIKEYIPAPENSIYKLRAYVYELFILLGRAYVDENNVLHVLPEASKQVKNRYVNEFLRMVGAEYTQERTIYYYAEKLDITPNYLNEMVKKSLGMNAKQYVQNRLTLEAKRLLIYTSLSVGTIAKTLCFENASYFVRFFRVQTGHTPLQYRNKVRSGLFPNGLGL